jgi:glutathione S-transferase
MGLGLLLTLCALCTIVTLSEALKLSMGVTLYGAQTTRSPLVNWFLIENNIPFTQKPPRPSNHPFGQVPFLTDDGGVEVFESGACLLYLQDAYCGGDAKSRAKYTKWVVWANAEFEAVCFGHKMSGTQLERPNRAVDVLEKLLGGTDFIVDNTFSLADVAVASYLNYVPVFFKCNLASRPNIVKYMVRCAERPAFRAAFGDDHADVIIRKGEEWLGPKKASLW